MADIPPTVREIAAGACSAGSQGRQVGSARPPRAAPGIERLQPLVQGRCELGGWYHGYDGPYPPPNDLRTHRYFFRLFALDTASLDLPESFTATQLQRAMQGHVLAEAAIYGTYSLHPGAK